MEGNPIYVTVPPGFVLYISTYATDHHRYTGTLADWRVGVGEGDTVMGGYVSAGETECEVNMEMLCASEDDECECGMRIEMT